MKLLTQHIVHPANLNHHGCLYGGTLAEWMTEAAFIAAASLLGGTAGVVLAATKELAIRRSTAPGTILVLEQAGVSLGRTSITVTIVSRDSLTGQEKAQGTFVFVTVDGEGRKRPHHLTAGESKNAPGGTFPPGYAVTD